MTLERELSLGPEQEMRERENDLSTDSPVRLNLHENKEQSTSVREDLRSSLTGTIQELVTQILSDQDLKLEKTTTCYESQVVLPLTMALEKSPVGTLGMEVKLLLKLRVVPTPSSEETSPITQSWSPPSKE